MMTIEKRLLDLAVKEMDHTTRGMILRKELEDIQADCPHANLVVRDAGLFGRSYYKFCVLCRKELGRPETWEELEQQKLLEEL